MFESANSTNANLWGAVASPQNLWFVTCPLFEKKSRICVSGNEESIPATYTVLGVGSDAGAF